MSQENVDAPKLSRAERRRMRKRPAATGFLRAIDTSGKHEPRQLGIGHGRGAIVVGHGAIWVAHGWGRSVVRLDPSTLAITAALTLGKPPAAIAAGRDAIWVLGANGWLWHVLPAGPIVEGVARLGRLGRALAASDGSLWALRAGGELAKIDPVSGELALKIRVERPARHLVANANAVWAGVDRGRKLVRINTVSGAVDKEVRGPGRTVALSLEGDELWVTWRRGRSRGPGGISAFDARNGELRQEHPLPELPRALAAGPDAIWIACGRKGRVEASIIRLDPRSGSLETVDKTYMPICHLALAGPLLLATLSLGANSYAADGSSWFFLEGSDLGGGFGSNDGGVGDGSRGGGGG